jgi:hypothetical protein
MQIGDFSSKILIKFNNQLVKQYDKWDFQFEVWTLPKIVDVAREQNKFLKAQKKSLINTIQIIQSVEWYHDGEVTEVPMMTIRMDKRQRKYSK